MNLCRSLATIMAASACGTAALAQWKLPDNPNIRVASKVTQQSTPVAIAAQGQAQSPILWMRNDKTGQVIYPNAPQIQGNAQADPPPPITVFNNLTHTGGWSAYNLNWNYAEIYTNPNFTQPPTGDSVTFFALNISSDPSDPDEKLNLVNGEKISILIEPWTAATWPVEDLNTPQLFKRYTSVYVSLSEQLEIRVCRIYFYSLLDVNLPFDAITNPYSLDNQLSFAFVSLPYQYVATPVSFNLEGFNPPLTTKGQGLVMTHWMQLTVPPPCPADLNGDTLVDDADFSMFIVQYDMLDCEDENMPYFCSADLNGDAMVDDADFSIFIVAYDTLLCPEPTVVRQVYAPLAGGRVRWNTDNFPVLLPEPSTSVSVAPWPHPNSLVTVSNPAVTGANYGDEPSFRAFLTTKTGFHTLDAAPLNENEPAATLKAEYQRFLNACVAETVNGNGALRQHAFYDPESFIQGGYDTAEWLPSVSPKLLQILPPVAPQ